MSGITNPAPFHTGARATRTTAQAITTNATAFTAVSFDSVWYDTNSCWSIGQPTRLVIPIDGYYLVGGNIRWAGNATGSRAVQIFNSGANAIAQVQLDVPGSTALAMNVGCVNYFAAGDYVELQVRQNSGGNLNVQSSVQFTPEFWISYLGT